MSKKKKETSIGKVGEASKEAYTSFFYECKQLVMFYRDLLRDRRQNKNKTQI